MAPTLVSMLQDRAQAHPEKIAFEYLRSNGEVADSLGYGDLLIRATLIAGYLQRRFGSGERMLLLFPPGLDFVTSLFGCLMAGMVAVPLAPPARRGSESLGLVAADSAASAILGAGVHFERWRDGAGAGSRAAGLEWIAVEDIDAGYEAAWRAPAVSPGGLALLQYTSGSTRTPRGVALSHDNILANSRLIQRCLGAGPQTVAVSWLPFHHDMGLIGNIIQPLYAGASWTVMAPTTFLHRPQLWLQTISTRRATVSGGPSFAYEQCVIRIKEADLEGLDLASWEVAYCGAEPIRADVMTAFGNRFRAAGFRPRALMPGYGLAEATLTVTSEARNQPPQIVAFDSDALGRGEAKLAMRGKPATELVGCGAADSGQRVAIVAAGRREPLGPGQLGEIWVQGEGVAAGYYRRPEEDYRFNATLEGETGRWLRTGDLGFIHADQLFVLGRSHDQLVVQGRNLFAHDIEWALGDLYPGLGRSVAFAGEQADQLVVVQELRVRGAPSDYLSLVAEIRRRVTAAMGVDLHAIAIVASGTIPFTTSGKPRRLQCRERYLSGKLPLVGHWKRADDPAESGGVTATCRGEEEIEAWLVERLALRLQLAPDKVDPRAPFVDYGLTSLDAVELCAELEAWLRRPLSPTIIYSRPTVSALSEWLARGRKEAPAQGVPSAPPEQGLDLSSLSAEEIEAWITRQYDSESATD